VPSDGFLALISDNPKLITAFGILAIVGYALKLASQMSETFAGLLGGIGRRWREQGERRTRSALNSSAATNAVVVDLRAQLEHFVGRVKTLERNATERARVSDVKDDYLVYDAEWHARIEMHGAQAGWVFPPPAHKTYTEFLDERASSQQS
jgi:hypothetical protein